MARSMNNLILICLLVTFAIVVQPSAAIRAEVSANVPPAPAPVGAPHVLPTSSLFPPDFPCMSILPPFLLQLCHALFASPSNQVKECGSYLARMKPCVDFLKRHSNVSSPSDECCDAFDSINDDGATICYCRLAVGDVGKVLPKHLNLKRLFKIPKKCDSPVTLEPYAHCAMDYVPPIDIPSPPPSDDDYTDD